jgi:hypothetical protein
MNQDSHGQTMLVRLVDKTEKQQHENKRRDAKDAEKRGANLFSWNNAVEMGSAGRRPAVFGGPPNTSSHHLQPHGTMGE